MQLRLRVAHPVMYFNGPKLFFSHTEQYFLQTFTAYSRLPAVLFMAPYSFRIEIIHQQFYL